MEAAILQNDQKKFFIQQFTTGCLSHMAYYVESEKIAVLIDPLRDTQPYFKLAESRGATIKFVYLTHFHADFVAGHLEIMNKTGAKIVLGPKAEAKYDLYIAKDGEFLTLGSIKFQVIHTPGHTMESSCFLLINEDKPFCIFTGDTLFLNEVGRPDLAVSSTITKEDLASFMYESLQKLITLPDEVIVYPGHGAGSPCGKKIAEGTSDTLGNQKKTNYALQKQEKADFVKSLTSEIPVPPQYFFHDASLNKMGYEPLDSVVKKNLVGLTLEQFKNSIKEGCILLDTRPQKSYLEAFIPNSYSINLQLNFAIFVGTLISPDQEFVLITDVGKEMETIVRMSRIGYDKIRGFLTGGIETWIKAKEITKSAELITAKDFSEKIQPTKPFILDVRNLPERVNGFLPDSVVIPVKELEAKLKNDPKLLPKDKRIYCVCRTGGRATIAISILSHFGYEQLSNIEGGMVKFVAEKLPISF